jgi:Fe2+ or Zn2+ uptake regulation protein
MGLDTGSIFKRPVLCEHCNEHYLFTLRTIAHGSDLKCPSCGNAICIDNSEYEGLLRDVRNALHEIDCASLAPAVDRR